MSTEFQLLKNKDFLAFKLSDVLFILLIIVKMPTMVGILTFMSMINFMLSSVEHTKFYNPRARFNIGDRNKGHGLTNINK